VNTTQFNASHFGAAAAAWARVVQASGESVVVVLVNKMADDIPYTLIVHVPDVPVAVVNV